ncbi:sensor histidine kinase [Kineococcus sp. SYSU DK006]|uniref:sensor histidine kinase n=1 Tax=Kineococcus sp. SYSU DK006 TaxID=3383127 RepID=UPI003D7DF1F8
MRAFAGSPWALVLLAAVCFSVVAPVTAGVYGVPPGTAMAAALLQCSALVLALFRPSVAVVSAVTGVVVAAVAAEPTSGPWPWMPQTIVVFSLLLALLGVRRQWRLGIAAWASSMLLTVFLAGVQTGFSEDACNDLVVHGSNSALLLAAGSLVGARRRVREELALSRRHVQAESERRVVVEERNRIARELHDVVAHSMSVIGVQATTAQYRLGELDPRVRAEFDDIAAQARTALAEMRTLLGVLRGSGEDADRAPQPGLEGLDGLAEGARRAGSRVHLHVDPPLRSAALPPSVGLVVHRIVQEGLANVVRHATGADVRVSVLRADPGIVLEVRNGPPPQGAGGVADSGGHGLVGVRERATLLRGSVSSGPLEDGGFLLRALLPWEGAA